MLFLALLYVGLFMYPLLNLFYKTHKINKRVPVLIFILTALMIYDAKKGLDIWFFIITLLILLLFTNEDIKKLYNKDIYTPTKKEIHKIILLGTVYFLIDLFLIFINKKIFTLYKIPISPDDVLNKVQNMDNLFKLFLYTLEIGLVAPITEEFCVRFFWYDYILSKKINKIFSILILSFIFALIHGKNYLIIPIFIGSIFLHLIYDKYGYKGSVMFHSVHNILTLFFYIIKLKIFV